MNADTRVLLRWVGIPCGLLAVLLYVGIYYNTQRDKEQLRADLQTPPELDVKQLPSLPKAKIESIFGVAPRNKVFPNPNPGPLAGKPYEIAYYPWGSIEYDEGGKFNVLTYLYKSRPHSIDAALKRVGLEETSEPLRFKRLNRWCPRCTPPSPALFCGGLQLNVTIFDAVDNDGFEMIEVFFLPYRD
jgi:hypothetical protein